MSEVKKPAMSRNLVEFNRIYKETDGVYHEIAGKLSLSDSMFEVLYAICELGDGCVQKEICDATYLPKQTVHSSIQKLLREGFLTMEPGGGRSRHIRLTERGRGLLREKVYPVIQIENEAFSALTPEECNLMISLHEKWCRALRNGIERL